MHDAAIEINFINVNWITEEKNYIGPLAREAQG